MTHLYNLTNLEWHTYKTLQTWNGKLIYCEIILFCGVFNYVEFVGKTIHEFKYPRYKIPSVRLSSLLVNNINIWYEPCILQVRNVI